MSETFKMLFLNNPDLEEMITAFCAKNPDYCKLKQEFYETASEILKIVGYDLYNQFECSFGSYLACSNDLYYRFGLGLRQEVLSALQSEMP